MVDSPKKLQKIGLFSAPPCTRCRTSALERTKKLWSLGSNCWGPMAGFLENILKNILIFNLLYIYIILTNMYSICFSDDFWFWYILIILILFLGGWMICSLKISKEILGTEQFTSSQDPQVTCGGPLGADIFVLPDLPGRFRSLGSSANAAQQLLLIFGGLGDRCYVPRRRFSQVLERFALRKTWLTEGDSSTVSLAQLPFEHSSWNRAWGISSTKRCLRHNTSLDVLASTSRSKHVNSSWKETMRLFQVNTFLIVPVNKSSKGLCCTYLLGPDLERPLHASRFMPAQQIYTFSAKSLRFVTRLLGAGCHSKHVSVF